MTYGTALCSLLIPLCASVSLIAESYPLSLKESVLQKRYETFYKKFESFSSFKIRCEHPTHKCDLHFRRTLSRGLVFSYLFRWALPSKKWMFRLRFILWESRLTFQSLLKFRILNKKQIDNICFRLIKRHYEIDSFMNKIRKYIF